MKENRKPLINLMKAQYLYGMDATIFIRPRYVPEGYCEWCGKKNDDKRRTSCCSKECSRKFGIATSPVYYANVCSRGGYGNHILRRDRYTCQFCGEFHGLINEHGIALPTTDGQLMIYHKKQVQHGGSDSPDNLITLCKSCHRYLHSKGAINT